MASFRRLHSPWLAAAFIFSSSFLVSFLLVFAHGQIPSLVTFAVGKHKPKFDFPDFNKYIHTRTLSDEDFGLDDPNRRVIIIGDVHGMNKSLHKLLHAVSYHHANDTLLFAGDMTTKSTHEGSQGVLEFLSTLSNTARFVGGVRGNHDQTVIQWRVWRDWFETLTLPIPHADTVEREGKRRHRHKHNPVSTGREFLALIERDWEREVERDPRGADAEEWVDLQRKTATATWRAEWWRRIPEPGRRKAAKDFKMFSDHYWLARDMTPAQREFMYALPLVLHVPSVHLFLVHAGLVPYNPRRSPTDVSQPLAHHPLLVAHADDLEYPDGQLLAPAQEVLPPDVAAPQNENALRLMQEHALLAVAQNRDPWVVLNMRGIKKKGKVTRVNDEGTPWSKVWDTQMRSCAGFGTPAPPEGVAQPPLPCMPATVVYAHAATRGLDVKRWSLGLDSGCVYGWRLSALVLQREAGANINNDDDEYEYDGDEDEDDEDDEDDAETPTRFNVERTFSIEKRKTKTHRVRFGDEAAGIRATITSVRCEIEDDTLLRLD